MKPKIAIVIDKKGWAFSNAADQIKKNLSKYYSIDILSIEKFGDDITKLFVKGDKYKLMFFMWRAHICWLYTDYTKECIRKLGYEVDEFMNKYVENKNILTGVFDHMFLNAETERTDYILDNVKGYIVCSEKLKKLYDEYNHNKKPNMVISDGVDLKLFKMTNKHKFDNIENRVIKIGWAGNSKFIDEKDDDLKGLQRVIKPAIEELIQEGYPIQLDIADRNIKSIPHNKMSKYYNDIDIYICASRTEGHPEPILESMACGVPIISTDVGIVSEVFGKEQKKYIIERTKEDLKNKIIDLTNNREKLKKLSEENLEQIKKWSWEEKAKLYKKFLDQYI